LRKIKSLVEIHPWLSDYLAEVELTLPTLEEKYSKLLQNYEELKCKHAQLQQNLRDQNREIVKKYKAADSLMASVHLREMLSRETIESISLWWTHF
jgi:vacuolar-type H+-ATPase subunit D/Vma8